MRLIAVAVAVATGCAATGDPTTPAAPTAARSRTATVPAGGGAFATSPSPGPAATTAPPGSYGVPAGSPDITAPPAGPVTGGDLCGEKRYRCVTLDEAIRWWDGKPALAPPSGTSALRAMLHSPDDPDVRRSDAADLPPSFTYVLPDRLFPMASTLKGGITTAARNGGVVVGTYFTTEKWLPRMDEFVSRPIRVRGHDGILSVFRTSDSTSAIRDLKWWVPHGDGTYIVWLVEDDDAYRTEQQLLDLVNGLVEQ